MQQMFNKNLEEIKKSKSIINNEITEIKNTLEGTNSRITEQNDSRITRRQNGVINEAQRKKEKNNKQK